jgi:hypothetical protein
METTQNTPAAPDYESTTHRYVRGTVRSGANKGMPSTGCAKCGNGATSKLHKAPFGRVK